MLVICIGNIPLVYLLSYAFNSLKYAGHHKRSLNTLRLPCGKGFQTEHMERPHGEMFGYLPHSRHRRIDTRHVDEDAFLDAPALAHVMWRIRYTTNSQNRDLRHRTQIETSQASIFIQTTQLRPQSLWNKNY